jgi:hypothetical protein
MNSGSKLPNDVNVREGKSGNGSSNVFFIYKQKNNVETVFYGLYGFFL